MADREPFQGRVQSRFYYTAQWKRLRITHLMKEPLCRHCNEKGIVTPAVDIDHIIPINPHNAWDYDGVRYGSPVSSSNLQSLCKKCHAKKTAASRGVEQR